MLDLHLRQENVAQWAQTCHGNEVCGLLCQALVFRHGWGFSALGWSVAEQLMDLGDKGPATWSCSTDDIYAASLWSVFVCQKELCQMRVTERQVSLLTRFLFGTFKCVEQKKIIFSGDNTFFYTLHGTYLPDLSFLLFYFCSQIRVVDSLKSAITITVGALGLTLIS